MLQPSSDLDKIERAAMVMVLEPRFIPGLSANFDW
jgi:hypothetical protein